MKDNIRGFSVDASPLSFKNKLLLFRSPQSYVIVYVTVFTQEFWRELLFVLVFVLSLITKCLITVNVTVIALHQGGSLVVVWAAWSPSDGSQSGGLTVIGGGGTIFK